MVPMNTSYSNQMHRNDTDATRGTSATIATSAATMLIAVFLPGGFFRYRKTNPSVVVK